MSSEPSDLTVPEVRLILRVVGAFVLLAIAAGVATLCTREESDDGTAVQSHTPADAIGPLPGTPLATYASRRAKALAELDGRRAAVVSFTRYRTEDAAGDALGDVDVRALLVASPGGAPHVVTSSLDDWVSDMRAEATRERRNLDSMMDTEDPSFRAQFQEDIARLDAFLARLDPDGEVVFGAVVVAGADDLRALAARPPVRLVDIGASRAVPDRGRVRGVRPEETVRSGTPPERGL